MAQKPRGLPSTHGHLWVWSEEKSGCLQEPQGHGGGWRQGCPGVMGWPPTCSEPAWVLEPHLPQDPGLAPGERVGSGKGVGVRCSETQAHHSPYLLPPHAAAKSLLNKKADGVKVRLQSGPGVPGSPEPAASPPLPGAPALESPSPHALRDTGQGMASERLLPPKSSSSLSPQPQTNSTKNSAAATSPKGTLPPAALVLSSSNSASQPLLRPWLCDCRWSEGAG